VVVAAAAAGGGGGGGGGESGTGKQRREQQCKQGVIAAGAGADAVASLGSRVADALPDLVPSAGEEEGAEDPEAERLAVAASLLLASNGRPAVAAAGSNGTAGIFSEDDLYYQPATEPAADGDGAGTMYDVGIDDPVIEALSLPEEAEVGPEELSVAVGILRQTGADDEVALGSVTGLSHRVLQLLELVDNWPGRSATASHTRSSTSSGTSSTPGVLAGSSGDGVGVGGRGEVSVTCSFWEDEWVDEWSDVRAALMSVGVDAGVVDSMEEEDVSKWAEGEREASRPRLLRTLPKFDADGAKKLGVLLQELRQQRVEELGAQQQQLVQQEGRRGQGEGGEEKVVGGGQSVQSMLVGKMEEEAAWWEEVAVAYQGLWTEAQALEKEQRVQERKSGSGEGAAVV
jgi:hypothetical protein